MPYLKKHRQGSDVLLKRFSKEAYDMISFVCVVKRERSHRWEGGRGVSFKGRVKDFKRGECHDEGGGQTLVLKEMIVRRPLSCLRWLEAHRLELVAPARRLVLKTPSVQCQ